MKIAYVYYEDMRRAINYTTANIVQTFNSCNAFGEVAEVTFYHGYVKENALRKCFDRTKIKHGFKIVKLPIFPLIYFPVLEQLGRVLFFLQVLFKMRKENFDLIYTRDYSFLYFLNIFSFLKPKAIIFYEAHKVYHVASNKVLSSKIEAKAINKNCEHVFTVTDYIAADLKRSGVSRPMTTLRNGVDMSLFSSNLTKLAARQALGVPTAKFIALYAGSFLDWKGVDFFLEAACISKNPNLLFIAIGGGPQELESYQKKFGNLENLVILGSKDRGTVAKYMAASDAGVIPTIITASGEGQWYTNPLKMVEYMAAGLPIVASNLPSIRNFLSSENAIFFEQGNSADLLKKIENLMESPDLIRSIKERNLEKVQDCSFEKRARIILRNYRQIKTEVEESMIR